MLPRDLYMKYCIFGIGIVLFDQISKFIIRNTMAVGESIPILGDFFSITYIQNRGAAFSMFSGERILLIVLPVLLVAGAMWYFLRKTQAHWLFYTSWAMILAGGIGNLIDRILFGWVTDMLDFSIFPPVFNIADIGVTLGCGILVVYVLMEERFQKHE